MIRHDHGRRRVPLHVGIVAARPDRADRQRDGSAREARRARLSAHHVQRSSMGSGRERTRLYRVVEFVGRWSMLDVFVAVSVALVQLPPLMSVAPGPGILFFAAWSC